MNAINKKAKFFFTNLNINVCKHSVWLPKENNQQHCNATIYIEALGKKNWVLVT
jgi:hypothetical protein